MVAFRCFLGPYRSAFAATVIATLAAVAFARSQMPAEPLITARAVMPDTTRDLAQDVAQEIHLDITTDVRIVEICALDRRLPASGPARPS